jgi:hypothetical protein
MLQIEFALVPLELEYQATLGGGDQLAGGVLSQSLRPREKDLQEILLLPIFSDEQLHSLASPYGAEEGVFL